MAGLLRLGLALALDALLQLCRQAPPLRQLVLVEALGGPVGALLALQAGQGLVGRPALALQLVLVEIPRVAVGGFLALQARQGVLGGPALALQLGADALEFLLEVLVAADRVLGALELAFQLAISGEAEHLAPGRQLLDALVGPAPGAHIAPPQLGVLRHGLDQGAEMRRRLGVAAGFGHQMRQTLVRLRVALVDRQDVAPGLRLSGHVARPAKTVGQPPPTLRPVRRLVRDPA